MKGKPRAPKPKPFLATLSASSGPSLIRHLASCNASIRYQSLKLIQAWLSTSETQLPEDDMKRLWKGLFYCLWHSDKAPAQAQLINRLSSLLLILDPLLSLQYFSNFLVTLRREWNGIDQLRLDKFYLLIRRFMHGMFCLMRKYKWDLEYLGKYVEALEDKAFLADDKLLGNGVNYHIASVFLDELKGFRVPLARKEVIESLFGPLFNVIARSMDKVLVGKVKSCVFDVLLNTGRGLLEKTKNGVGSNEGENGEVFLGIIALKMGLSGRFYEVGSSPGCIQGNRKVVFGLHEEFLKLEKELEALGIEVGLPEISEVDDDDGEEVSYLIPIDNGEFEVVGVKQDAQPVVEEERDPKKKKKKKAKKGSDKKDKDKKKKKKEKNVPVENGLAFEENGGVDIADNSENGKVGVANAVGNGIVDTQNGDVSGDENKLDFSESVISKLQLQFEKVASEMGSDEEDDKEASDLPLVTMKKKRKRDKIAGRPNNPEISIPEEDGVSGAKSAKKVKFAIKNNLVWKPHSPLPPQSLRLPPSVTPRGSALKKGVPPGPIREMPPVTKKVKKMKKNGRKILRTISPAVKRLKKVKALSV